MVTGVQTCALPIFGGINTNIALHRDLMEDKRFNEGGTSIHYLEKLLAETKRSS